MFSSTYLQTIKIPRMLLLKVISVLSGASKEGPMEEVPVGLQYTRLNKKLVRQQSSSLNREEVQRMMLN